MKHFSPLKLWQSQPAFFVKGTSDPHVTYNIVAGSEQMPSPNNEYVTNYLKSVLCIKMWNCFYIG